MAGEVQNYYAVLGCEEHATNEEIKKCYHEKALKFHPDKSQESDKRGNISFDLIIKAWNTLNDAESRRIYDAKLNEHRLSTQTLVYGTFSHGELEFDSDTNMYSTTCRCGGLYIVHADDLKPEDCLISVECDTCSLMINIKN